VGRLVVGFGTEGLGRDCKESGYSEGTFYTPSERYRTSGCQPVMQDPLLLTPGSEMGGGERFTPWSQLELRHFN